MIALLAVGAQAHLMTAQHGTLNLRDDGGYLVLSLPVSAFEGVDDDHDGLLSPAEHRAHEADLVRQVERGVRLQAPDATLPLQGVLTYLSPDHAGGAASDGLAPQVVVLGRFAPAQGDPPLTLALELYGVGPTERSFEVTVTRAPDTATLSFTPDAPSEPLFPSPTPLGAARLGAVLLAGVAAAAGRWLFGPQVVSFRPTTPATISPTNARRSALTGSPSHAMPTIAVPAAAPMPTHTA